MLKLIRFRKRQRRPRWLTIEIKRAIERREQRERGQTVASEAPPTADAPR